MTDRCQRLQCGRKLTDPTSRELGYGPVCYRKVFGCPAPVRGGTPVGPVPLFELPDAPALVAEQKPTPGARRIARQAEVIRRGYHPLGVALRINLPLHEAAPRSVDRKAPGPRCGTCAHRVVPLREVSGTYPKCNYGGDWRHATGGPGTDVRAWWPACHHYTPKEEGTTGDQREVH